MTDWLPDDWSTPQLLLVALVLAVAVTGVVAGSTSQSPFGTYNAAWDGTSDLRTAATEYGTEPVVALNTTAYAEADPNETVAVVLSPDQPYTPREQARLVSFVEQGGTIVFAEDYGTHTDTLLTAVGAETRLDGAPLRDEQAYYRSPAFPLATNVSSAPETDGVDQLTLNHGTSLQTNASSNGTTVLVSSSEFAYLDLDRDGELDEAETLESRPVAVRESVGNGTVYVVSDPSVFINAMLERPGNKRFARNLVTQKQNVLFDYSHHAQQPPVMVALLTIRGNPLLQGALGALGIVAIVFSRQLWTTRDAISERFRSTDRTKGQFSLAAADQEEIVAYLASQHPEWDEERLRRVMRGVIRTDDSTESND
jgi:hypothetical protein